jgi:hypothetical protein
VTLQLRLGLYAKADDTLPCARHSPLLDAAALQQRLNHLLDQQQSSADLSSFVADQDR